MAGEEDVLAYQAVASCYRKQEIGLTGPPTYMGGPKGSGTVGPPRPYSVDEPSRNESISVTAYLCLW